VHKPGAVPLRPLLLGDFFDAAFKVVRHNAKATMGSAVLVAAVSMLVPVLVSAVATWAFGVTVDLESDTASRDDAIGLGVMAGSLLVGTVLQWVGLSLVTGMIAHVVAAATLGRTMDLGQAWAATRGSRWRLLGLAFTMSLVLGVALVLYVLLWVVLVTQLDTAAGILLGLLSLPFAVAALVWAWVRFFLLPVPALALEGRGVLSSLARGRQLTRGQFWRILGVALLTVLMTQVAAGMLSFPLSLLGQVFMLANPEQTFFILVLTQALSTVVAAAFVTPFTACVTTLQYLDQRIRKEAFDLELARAAGLADL